MWKIIDGMGGKIEISSKGQVRSNLTKTPSVPCLKAEDHTLKGGRFNMHNKGGGIYADVDYK
jgi:hypothetical protein